MNNNRTKIFRRNEKSQLLGHGYGRLWLMSFLMLVAAGSIGFATASLNYLEDKMSNPFVSCVDIVIDQLWSHGYEELDRFVDDECHKKEYHYNSSEKVWLLSSEFLNKDKRAVRLDGRTIYMNSPILERTIFSEENVICKKYSVDDSDFGIILSNEGLKKLNDTKPDFVILPVYVDDSTSCEVTVPVLAIVKELPDMCDFLMTHGYAQHVLRANASHFNVSTVEFNKRMKIVCKSDDHDAVVNAIRSNEEFEITDENAIIPYDGSWSDEYNVIEVVTDSAEKYNLYQNLFSELKSQIHNVYRIYELGDNLNTDYDRDPQIYSCYFSMSERLPENVENFRAALKETTGHRLDMSKIDSLKNLAKVQALGNILSWGIFGISIIFIIVFIYFLMSMHFQKIQKNLGTFKAFGINTTILKRIYVSIIVEMVVVSFAIAAFIAAVVTIPVNIFIPREGVYSWVDIFVWQNGVLLIVSLLAAIITVTVTAGKMLKKSPGDLIYDRKQF